MKTLFDYCFYRASKFYEDWGESNGHIGGGVVVFASIGFIFASLCVFVLYLFDKNVTNQLLWVIVVIVGALSCFLTRKKYEKLVEKYKDEKNSKLKGRLVFIYIIGSVILYFVSLYIFDV